MTWSLHSGDELLEKYQEAWQTLNARCYGAHPLLDTKFIVPLYECFGSDSTMLMVQEERPDNVVGLALVEKASVGVWRLFMPSQANVGPILLDDCGSATRACQHLDELMQSLPGLPWQLGLQKQDPLYSSLAQIDHESRLEYIPDWNTTHIDTDGEFDSFWRARDKNVRQGVKRILKRLEAEGISLRLERLFDYGSMAAGVRNYGILESAGWKGCEGTAIRHDNVQGEFYTRVLQNFAGNNNAIIYQLYFNDRLAASLLTINQNQMLVVLKTTYDESMSDFSPGRLIDYLMLERVFGNPKIHRIENYTNASGADARWCSGTRLLYHVNFYRSGTLRRVADLRKRMRGLSGRWRIGHKSLLVMLWYAC